jgi:hypothetical protein
MFAQHDYRSSDYRNEFQRRDEQRDGYACGNDRRRRGARFQ